MNFEYLYQPPKKWTFEQLELKRFVESYCIEPVLNLFAGKTKLSIKEVRVDSNPEMPANFHMDAMMFLNSWNGDKFGSVILDPPYSVRKGREKYLNHQIGKLTKIKNRLMGSLVPGGRVISLGYDSVGMSQKRGFIKIAICLVCHSGDHNDTICLVEEMNQLNLLPIQ